MMYRRMLFSTFVLVAALSGGISAQELRPFTPEVALDMRTVRIAAVTERRTVGKWLEEAIREKVERDGQRAVIDERSPNR